MGRWIEAGMEEFTRKMIGGFGRLTARRCGVGWSAREPKAPGGSGSGWPIIFGPQASKPAQGKSDWLFGTQSRNGGGFSVRACGCKWLTFNGGGCGVGGVFSGGCGTGGTAEKQLGLVVLRSCGGHRDEQGRDFFELQIGRGRPRSPLFAVVFSVEAWRYRWRESRGRREDDR